MRKDFIEELNSPDWAEMELEGAPLGDRRLARRLSRVAADFARRPGAPIAEACQTSARIEGAYRFLENDFIEPEQILCGHRHASLERLAREPVVLAVQDSTTFNFSAHPATLGLGPIGRTDQAQGLWLHSTATFTPTGLPLGLVGARFWSRAPEPVGKYSRETKPFARKESVRWRESWEVCQKVLEELPRPNLWVNIADMEGDIYEVFAAALAHAVPRVELLIRSRQDRKLEAPNGQWLWDQLASRPVAGTLEVRLAHHPKVSLVSLQIRFAEVQILSPKRKAGLPALQLWAVEARQVHPPAGCQPIRWRLLTTLVVDTLQAAKEKVHWYAQRWSIEVFHKILKSVCRAEKRQLATAERLKRALMIDLIVAWRVQVLTRVGRQNPQLPASDYFAPSEWQALESYLQKARTASAQSPTLGQMVLWIGRLGGFLKSRANPHPGPLTLARGLARLNDLAQMWVIQNEKM